ncbi:MAG: ATP-binding cassette domain-containing protein [Clostridiales bacterium]|nr:ATP-binding cassette domain-containing protein [Clostridiales bacterium]
METFKIEDLSFYYPLKEQAALSRVNLTIGYGEFVVVCGQTGCGKSTLLKNLKTILRPHGKKEGQVYFYGRALESVELREQVKRIGFVLQNPDNQIVTDKVWHELAFGLENLGYDTRTIRLRVAEMASFFGIQEWFMKNVSELSGGQKQLLNLASVMAMQPDVLILDEPTSQLDPIAAVDFLETLQKINREIGTAVIISEHRLEDVLTMADRVLVLDKGSLIADDTPRDVGKILSKINHPMLAAMPTSMQIFNEVSNDGNFPITVREGRSWLTELFKDRTLKNVRVEDDLDENKNDKPIIKMKDVWFRYSREGKDVIKGLSMEVLPGQIYSIVGGNATGKSTALKLIGGILKPYRGRVEIGGKKITKHVDKYKFNRKIGILPQNPEALFVEKTVKDDLAEVLDDLSMEERKKRLHEIYELLDITELLDSHPFDLSGGEQQRVALAKVLLLDPEILLLDEPTKGIDSFFKHKLALVLEKLKNKGTTIVLVTHDIEFCAKYSDICSMFFNGSIVTTNSPNKFFSGNSFYTTAANRMSRHIFENAVTTKDVIALCQENLA